jgi:hypothetical protein
MILRAIGSWVEGSSSSSGAAALSGPRVGRARAETPYSFVEPGLADVYCGSLAMFAAMRRASSIVRTLAVSALAPWASPSTFRFGSPQCDLCEHPVVLLSVSWNQTQRSVPSLCHTQLPRSRGRRLRQTQRPSTHASWHDAWVSDSLHSWWTSEQSCRRTYLQHRPPMSRRKPGQRRLGQGQEPMQKQAFSF